MNSRIFLIGIIIFAIILSGLNLILTPVHAILNFAFIAGLVILAVLYTRRKQKEKYDFEYDYDRENPNALVTGYNAAGTVYASYPNNTPGLGWIL